MTQRDNILQELSELQSSLAYAGAQNVYQVPAGYFDNLIDQVLNRIKALDTEDAVEELNYLSPLLSGISKQMPYSVPANFFNGLAESIIESEKNNHQSPEEELETLSPLLSGLKKEMPYSVPQGYFEELNTTIKTEAVRPAVKVVSISITRQKWFRYAAAAVIIGFVAIGGVLFFTKKETIDPVTKSTEWVKKNMKKVSTDDIDKFVELADEEAQVVASADVSNEMKDKNEIKNLIKDVSDKDIENFLDETQTDETGNNDDALMN